MKLTFFKVSGITILSLLMLASNSPKPDVDTRPNVILFYLDDSGYGDFAHKGTLPLKLRTLPNLRKAV